MATYRKGLASGPGGAVYSQRPVGVGTWDGAVQNADGSWTLRDGSTVSAADHDAAFAPKPDASNNPFSDWNPDWSNLGAGVLTGAAIAAPFVAPGVGGLASPFLRKGATYLQDQSNADNPGNPALGSSGIGGTPNPSQGGTVNPVTGESLTVVPGTTIPTTWHPNTPPVAPPPKPVSTVTQPTPGATGSTSSPLSTQPAGPAPGGGLSPQIQSMLATYQAGRPTPAIAPTKVGEAQQATAGYASAPTVGPAQQATASTVNAPTLGPVAQGQASQANATDAVTAMIDQHYSDQTRAQQQQSIAGLTGAANGTIPSAAELQLRQTRDANVANQLGIAATLQGRSAGGALKQASDATGAINAKAAADAAILRATEQATARGQLSTALQGVRTSDIDVASNQGQLTSAANIATAANRTGVSQTNATLGTGVSTANAAQANQMAQKQGDLSLQAGETNANNATQTSQYNAGQGNMLTAKQADLLSQAGITNANNATSASATNANNSTSLVKTQADIDAQRSMNDVINQLKARGLDDEQIRAFIQSMVTSKGQDQQYAVSSQRNAIDQQNNLANQDILRAAAAWGKAKDVTTLVGSGATAIFSSKPFSDWWSSKFGNAPVDPVKAVSDPSSPAYNPGSPAYDPTHDNTSPVYDPASEGATPEGGYGAGNDIPPADDGSLTTGEPEPT